MSKNITWKELHLSAVYILIKGGQKKRGCLKLWNALNPKRGALGHWNFTNLSIWLDNQVGKVQRPRPPRFGFRAFQSFRRPRFFCPPFTEGPIYHIHFTYVLFTVCSVQSVLHTVCFVQSFIYTLRTAQSVLHTMGTAQSVPYKVFCRKRPIYSVQCTECPIYSVNCRKRPMYTVCSIALQTSLTRVSVLFIS